MAAQAAGNIPEGEVVIEPGIHIGLDHQAYLDDPGLGSSDLKTLLRSPPDWKWARPDNPFYKPPERGDVAVGLRLGSALHAWVLEGYEAFDARYRLPPQPPHGVLGSVEAIKAWLGPDRIPRPMPKRAEEWQALARAHGAPLYEDWKARQDEDPREIVDPDWLPVIELIDRQIKAHPQLGPLFGLGLPEISVFWDEGGVRRKARFDLIAPGVMVDAKSFSGWKKQDPTWALVSEVLTYGYHVQAANYLDAAAQIAGFLQENHVFFYSHDSDEMLSSLNRLELIAAQPVMSWIWLFTKTLEAPSIYTLTIEDVEEDEAIKAGRKAVRTALANYRAWMDAFGADELWLWPTDLVMGHDVPHWPDRLLYERGPTTPPDHLRPEEPPHGDERDAA